MKTTGILGKGFRQEIGVLVRRMYVRDFKLSVLAMFSQEVVPHVDVLRVRVGDRNDRQLNRTVVVLKNLDECIPKSGKRKRHMDRRKRASLKPSAIATYSVSLEGSVVHFCVLEIHWMAVPTNTLRLHPIQISPLWGHRLRPRKPLALDHYPSGTSHRSHS